MLKDFAPLNALHEKHAIDVAYDAVMGSIEQMAKMYYFGFCVLYSCFLPFLRLPVSPSSSTFSINKKLVHPCSLTAVY